MYASFSSRTGQATLSFVLLIGGIIIEVAIAGSFLVYALSNTRLSEKMLFRARIAAEAGLRDAQLRITRNKEIDSVSYNLDVGSDRATVNVVRGISADPAFYTYTIISHGVASGRNKKLQAIISVNASTGVATVSALNDLSL